MKWTQEQARAIELREKNILVAAAAGSGKTAVLVERIKRLILEDRCSIDRMLIVTFTNAAAAEMKEKIEKSIRSSVSEISERMDREDEGDKSGLLADLSFLKKQLDLLPNANISTFHSFALEVIRRYFYIIDVEPDFSICDDTQKRILRGKAMEQLMESLYERNDEAFGNFLDSYSGDRNDSRFMELISKSYDVLRSLPDSMGWLCDVVESLDGSLEDFVESRGMQIMWEHVVRELTEARKRLEETSETVKRLAMEKAQTFAGVDLKVCDDLLECVAGREFNAVKSALDGAKLPRFSTKFFSAEGSGATEAEALEACELARQNREYFKAVKKDLVQKIFFQEVEEHLEDMKSTYESGLFFKEALTEYHEIFSRLKEEKGVMDFDDIEHYALRILGDLEAAEFYNKKFEHIFIDEYQDSNVIQESLVATIRRDNNLFMVGDIKQSIYKFRLAEPEIFHRRYKAFAEEMALKGDSSKSEKIDLNKNFRSKRPIIDFINYIFEDIMEGYDSDAALYLGDPHGDRCPVEPKLTLVDTGWDDEGTEKSDESGEYGELGEAGENPFTANGRGGGFYGDAYGGDGSDGGDGGEGKDDDDDEAGDELKLLVRVEKEAMAAVKLVKEHLGERIFDSKAGVERPLEYGDMVILMRSLRGYGDLFYKIFTDNSIPAFVDDNDGYFDTMEINIFMNLLKIIDNPKQDIPLISVLRSEIFGFTVEELVDIRVNQGYGAYSDAFYKCAQGGDEGVVLGKGEDAKNGRNAASGEAKETDDELARKCGNAMRKLAEWRKAAKLLPLDEFIWELLLDTGFYVAMGAMPAGSQRQANLRALVDKAIDYGKTKDGSLYGFMNYIEAVKGNKISMGQVKLIGEGENTVRIMTIHKSKGLEFPMVILAGFMKETLRQRNEQKIGIHKDVGIAFPLVNYAEKWYRNTLMQNIIKFKTAAEDLEEEKRILYVAFTRAKDVLCILGSSDTLNKYLASIGTGSAKPHSYMDIAGKRIMKKSGAYEIFRREQLAQLSKARKRTINAALAQLDKKPDPDAAERLDATMTFAYPHIKEMEAKTKYSVSELNRSAFLSTTLAEPTGHKIHKAFTAARMGVIMHKILERMDFRHFAQLAVKDSDLASASASAEANVGVEKAVKALIESLVCEQSLQEDEAAAIDGRYFNSLVAFATGELCRRISVSSSVHKEKPFVILWDVDGVETVVQGIIDCYFEEADGLVLIDYKTTNVKSEEELERKRSHIADAYRTQIEIYKAALEKAVGKPVKEAYLYISDLGATIEM